MVPKIVEIQARTGLSQNTPELEEPGSLKSIEAAQAAKTTAALVRAKNVSQRLVDLHNKARAKPHRTKAVAGVERNGNRAGVDSSQLASPITPKAMVTMALARVSFRKISVIVIYMPR